MTSPYLKPEVAQKEYLEEKGEGISHLGFHVDDLDEEVKKMLDKGFKITSQGKFTEIPDGGFVWFNTDKVGGVQFELMKQPK